MHPDEIDTYTVGSGETKVLIIHGSGSAAKPFLRLGQVMVEQVIDCEVTAVSLAGYGSSVSNMELPIMEQHLAVLRQAMNSGVEGDCDQKWHLVGHSLGGFLALKIALAAPCAVASLSLIEPIALGVLDAEHDSDAIEQDRAVLRKFGEALDNGDIGVDHFIEAWNQAPWQEMPESVRNRLIDQARHIYVEVLAGSCDETRLTAYATLHQPTLLLAGQLTLLPARRVVEKLAELDAVVDLQWIAEARHMDVLQKPAAFASAIAAHIEAAVSLARA